MDDRLNRAADTRRRLLVACLATCAASDLVADDYLWRRLPHRIPAPATATGADANSERIPNPELIIREPLDDELIANNRQPEPPLANATYRPSSTPMRLAVQRRNAELAQADYDRSTSNRDTSNRQTTNPQARYGLTTSTLRFEADGSSIMPGFSTASLRQSAAKSLDESAARLAYRASHTAAQAATDALRFIAQSIDVRNGDGLATAGIESGLIAIREAEDFVGRYGHVDSDAIARMVRSHETTALKDFDTTRLSGIVAADIYLDSARQTFSSIAEADQLAAHAVGLLAKSYRQRATEAPLALATSVHLMRAAAAAVPNDRGVALELASVLEQAKLGPESQAVLANAMRLPAQLPAVESDAIIAVVSGTATGGPAGSAKTKQSMQVEQLSPASFASVSGREGGPQGASAGAVGATVNDPVVKPAKDGNPVSRAFKSMTRKWQ